MIPIDKTRSNDASYRYMMPLVHTEHQGANTVFTNFNELCSSLETRPEFCSKYLEIELGTTVKVYPKKLKLKGVHTTDRIQDTIYAFIEKLVLCPQCRLPEIRITHTTTDCDSCGYSKELSDGKMKKYISKFSIVSQTDENVSSKPVEWMTDFTEYLDSNAFKQHKAQLLNL